MNKKKKVTYAVIGIVAGLILITAGVLIGRYWPKVKKEVAEEVKTPPEVAEDITWQNPKEYERLYLFYLAKRFGNMDTDKAREKIQYYKVGKVNKGKYAGGDIVVVFAEIDGPAFYDDIYRIVRKSGKNYLLTKYSSELYENDGLDRESIILDKNYTIKDLEFPETIQNQDGSVHLTLVKQDPNVFFSMNGMKKVFEDKDVGPVYTNADYSNDTNWYSFYRNCFFVKSPDSTTEVYYLSLDFVKDNIPSVTWNSGGVNSQAYTYKGTGPCLTNDCLNAVNISQSELSVAGQTSAGNSVYLLKNSNSYRLKNFYNNEYYVPEGESKLSYSSFVAKKPLFYWKDSFDRFIEFKSQEFIPPGECGKPAVYLYPEQPMNVSVTVEPTGGITKSDPEYGSGWNVLALPSGKLFDWVRSRAYPYLFWEGNANGYQMPKKGFVVARENVSQFLDDKLASLGLVKNEIADFKEFWLPKMQSSPYYFVTFVDQRYYEMMAPMKVNPRPDTIIRVMMDYRPLEKPIKVESLEINTPIRKGFTVVEWGGMLHGEIK